MSIGSWLARKRAPAIDGAALLQAAHELEAAGRQQEAAANCERILAAEPRHRDALVLSARLAAQRGDLELARARFEAVLALDPNLAAAHADLGNVLHLAGELQAAGESYETALALDPALAAAWNNLGLNHLAGNHAEAAAAAFAEALARAPGFAEALRNLVSVNARLGRFTDSRQRLQAELARDPGNAGARAALGFVELSGFLDPALALDHFEEARALGLESAELLTNRGIALHDLGRINDAIESYDAALAADAQYRLARLNRGLAKLIEHRFADAWEDYEARAEPEAAPLAIPQWDGAGLAGKTLLIRAEQGLGDEIMFASCVPDVMARAGHCVIECAAKLEPLFRRSFAQATVQGGARSASPAWLDSMPQPDFQVRIGSLPRRLRTSLQDFPSHNGYLRADPAMVERWRARLSGLGPGAKVGLSWRGGTAQSRASLRSLPLERLAPLFAVPGVRFVSLQFDANDAEIASFCAASGLELAHFPEAMANYDETAALVAALDLVVSVCTAVIHLGGALGVPVWVMAPRVPEWRYGIAGETMPWYPRNRVLRQSAHGDWDGLIGRVARGLRARFAGAPGTPGGESPGKSG
jgi:tetratricopeptide (TPR) repeat protein